LSSLRRISLVAGGVHYLVIHTIIRAVCTLASEALVRCALERWQHLLVVAAQVRVVRQLVLDKRLLLSSSTCVGHVRVVRVAGVVPEVFGLHFALDQLRISWYIAHNFLARLAKASVDRKLLVSYAGRVRFWLQAFAGAHLIVLVVAGVVAAIAFEARITCGTSTVLTSP